MFLFIADFSPHLGSFCVVSSFTMFWPNFTSGLKFGQNVVKEETTQKLPR